jgi:outer membrane lipoprotein-sorting protein
MRIRAYAVAVAALFLAGCAQSSSGSSSFSGTEKDVAGVVKDLGKDAGRNKAADICDDLLTAGLRGKVAAGDRDCAEELEKAIKDADGYDFDVTKVTVTGGTAQARVRSRTSKDKDVVRTFTLQRQGSAWRISDFG